MHPMRELAAPTGDGFDMPVHLFHSPDGRHLHAFAFGGVVTWDLHRTSPEPARVRDAFTLPFHAARSPCGRWLAVCDDRHLTVHDLVGDQPRKHLPVNREFDHLADVCFTPDGRFVLTVRMGDGPGSGLDVRRVGTWRRWKTPRLVGGPGAFDGHLAVGPDGRRLATIHERPDAVAVWDYSTGRPLATVPTPKAADRAWVLADGSVLARYDWVGLIRHHPDTLESVASFRVPGRKRVELRTLTAHPDGRLLVLAGDGVVRLLDPLTLRAVAAYDFGLADVGRRIAFGLSVAPDGLSAAAAGGGRVVVFDLD